MKFNKKKIACLALASALVIPGVMGLAGCKKGHTHAFNSNPFYEVVTEDGVEVARSWRECSCGAENAHRKLDNAVIANTSNVATKIASAESGAIVVLSEGNYSLISLKGAEAFNNNITIAAEDKVSVDGLLITSGLTKQEYQTKSSVMPENLSITNINFIDDIQLRNCKISGLSIKNCRFSNEARIHCNANNYSAPYLTSTSALDGDIPKFGYDDIRTHNTSNVITNITIENNNFDGEHDTILEETTVIYLSSVNGATVKNNIINCAEFNGIQITSNTTSTGKMLVEGNIIKNTGSRSMRFSYFDDNAELIVKNNILSNANTLETNPEVIKSSSTGEASIYYEGNTYNGEAISIGNKITKAL